MQVVLWYHSLNRKKKKRNVSSEEQKRKMVMGENSFAQLWLHGLIMIFSNYLLIFPAFTF